MSPYLLNRDSTPFGRDWAVGVIYDNYMEDGKETGRNIEQLLQFLKRVWITETYDQLNDQRRYQIMWASPMGDNLEAVMQVTRNEEDAVETWLIMKYSEVFGGSA